MFQQDTVQYDKPLFVRHRHKKVIWKGREWTYGDYFPWQELGVSREAVRIWYDIGLLYHNPELEKEAKVGDRLSELNDGQILSLIRQVNDQIKKLCSTNKEYQNKKIKQSKIREKQQGLIRSWLYRNPSLAENVYSPIRDQLLGD